MKKTFRNLYHKITEEENSFKVDFWNWFYPRKDWKELIDFPNTVEGLEKLNEIHGEVNKALANYIKYMPRNQYF